MKHAYPENEIIDVDTGETKIGKGSVILRSSTIGSCVVIAGYSLARKVGVLAHIMVPGQSPYGPRNTKYAIDAIDELLSLMAGQGVKRKNIEVCLVGAANVLKEKDDTICKNNIDSVINYLREKKIKIRTTALGGIERRSLIFNIAKGNICYTEGESAEKLLCKVRQNAKKIEKLKAHEQQLEAANQQLRASEQQLKAANQQLKASETTVKETTQYARSLLEASFDPLVTISKDGKITDVNEATINATGVSRDKLIGTDFSSYFTEPKKARQGYREVFEKGSISDYP